jgi:hypothetical protein
LWPFTIILILIALISLSLLIPLPLTASYGSAAHSGLLKIKYPDQNATVAANNFIQINGTSAASNSTHTHCNVQLQINQDGYNPVKPNGAGGTYTNWTATSREIMKAGHNEIEAQLLCFPPGTPADTVTAGAAPNLIKHLVHNVTATT